MNRMLGIAMGLSVLLTLGCATESFVHKQMDPLAEKINKLDSRLAAVEAKLVDLDKKTAAEAADLQQVKQDLAAARGEIDRMAKAGQDSAAKADAAAARADAAAARAEDAANKAAKAFELGQKK